MSRQARKHAKNGIYHIMLRGIDRQRIFEEPQDYMTFQQILQENREQGNFTLYAYCLMSNHIHILLRVGSESLESLMKRIGAKYVYWFNIKYQRVGSLFQDRFKSEPVENDAYFLTVLRYIHQNPVKAGLCKKAADYPYSSYLHYLDDSQNIDGDFVLKMLPKEEFLKFHAEASDDRCLEISEARRKGVTDDQAREIIEKVSHCRTIPQFQCLDEKQKIRFCQRIHQKGVSIRQLSRLTGASKGLIERWLKDTK